MSQARQHAVADSHHVPQGQWPATRQFPTGPPATIGLLIVEGVVLREVAVGAHPVAELLGPGDLLCPWQREGEVASVPLRTSWTVLEPMHLAVLDRGFAQAINAWPEISAALVCRAMTRAAYASFYLALTNITRLDDRLLGLLWGLADRWGRVQTGGVLVPFRLTHSVLAQLVSARRPSVSRAAARLVECDQLQRTPRGCWRLTGDPPQLALPSTRSRHDPCPPDAATRAGQAMVHVDAATRRPAPAGRHAGR